MGSSESKTPHSETATVSKSETSESICSFEWNLEIQNGEHSIGQCMFSPPFKAENSEGPIWQLLLYPSGYMEQLQDYVAVFLQCLSKDYDHTSTTFSITLHSDDRPLEVRHKNVNVKCSRAMGWFTFLKRLHIGLTDADVPSKPKKVKLTCELTSCYTKKNFLCSYVLDRTALFVGTQNKTSTEIGNDLNDDGELSTDFSALYECGLFSDVILIAEGQNMKTHKVVLATRSPVFYCIFTQQKTTVDSLIMPKVSFKTCKRFLKFLYTGKTEKFTVKSAMNLYEVAHNYAVFALTERCIAYLKIHHELKNAMDVLRLANRYKESELKELMVDFISKNFKDVADTSAWKDTLVNEPAISTEVLCHMTTNYQQD